MRYIRFTFGHYIRGKKPLLIATLTAIAIVCFIVVVRVVRV